MKELNKNSRIGEVVSWSQIDGKKFQGVLKAWDSNVAIIDVNGKEMAVECECS